MVIAVLVLCLSLLSFPCLSPSLFLLSVVFSLFLSLCFSSLSFLLSCAFFVLPLSFFQSIYFVSRPSTYLTHPSTHLIIYPHFTNLSSSIVVYPCVSLH